MALRGMQIACVLIDEVHLLSENRGAALEAGAICRIKMVSKYHDLHQVQSPDHVPCEFVNQLDTGNVISVAVLPMAIAAYVWPSPGMTSSMTA